jgi:1-acyl-sn-glycerol-3-phosphate acyltransferase
MDRSRSLLYVRNGAFAVTALALSGVFFFTTPLALLPIRIGWPFIDAYLRGILFLLKWTCGMRYEVIGAERLQPGPVLIASAHQTTWENLFLPILLGNPAMIIKEEIFRYPLVGTISRKNGHIPAHRSGDLDKVRESMATAQQSVAAGRSVLIYPAGTRTGTDPDPPVRRGVAALYGTLGIRCVPVALNSGLYWQKNSWLRHPGTITVEILEPIPAGLDKKEFLETLTTRMHGATERLMHHADRPVLMPNLSAAARRIAGQMSPRGAEGG